jgi:serine acetyltransferase
MRAWVLQDWAANTGRPECQLILAWFRLAQHARANWGKAHYLIALPYRLVVTTMMGVELSPATDVGPRLRLLHPQGIVIHRDTKIGADVTMLHNVTIGNANDRAGGRGGVPVIGDHVELGAGAVVLGEIEVGQRARIGANAVVAKSIPSWAVVVGVPGRVVRIDDPSSLVPEIPAHG